MRAIFTGLRICGGLNAGVRGVRSCPSPRGSGTPLPYHPEGTEAAAAGLSPGATDPRRPPALAAALHTFSERAEVVALFAKCLAGRPGQS